VWAPTLLAVLLVPVSWAALVVAAVWIAAGAWLGKLVPRAAQREE
jgi:hypothetical protein